MKGIVFLPLLWIIGYLLGDGEYGAKVINGFEWLNTFYLIMLWIVGMLMVFILFVITFGKGSNEVMQSRINILGASAGSLLWAVATAIVYGYYCLTNEIIMNTNALATIWGDLGSTDLIIIFIVIVVLTTISSSFRNSE